MYRIISLGQIFLFEKRRFGNIIRPNFTHFTFGMKINTYAPVLRSLQAKNAFTLIELVVVVTILTILASIGYISYSTNIIDARDSQRQSDMDGLKIDLKTHKQKE